MTTLGDLLRPETPGERVIGTYLHPYCLLGAPDWGNPVSLTEVIARVAVETEDVHVTRNAGLFVMPPPSLPAFDASRPDRDVLQAKLEFEEKAARLFNMLICDLALHGVVSEPATPVHISVGKLVDGHALILSAGGGRETYTKRTVGPAMHLIQNSWMGHPVWEETQLTSAARLAHSTRLATVSSNLPALVAGAYSLFSRRQLSEALIDAWIVIEQLVDWFWTEYKDNLSDAERRDRLSDTRTYSAAVRIEVLHTIGRLEGSLYEALNRARKHRNALAHRAEINMQMGTETLDAMRRGLELFCGGAVEPAQVSSGVNW